jgi:hypothetical protein
LYISRRDFLFLLFSPIKIIVGIASSYAALLLLFGWLSESARVAFAFATVLELILTYIVYVGWRSLWSRFPKLNQVLFPDLNGDWIAKIHWVRDDKEGTVDATAKIKQDLIKMSIELDAPESDSATVALVVRKDPESGRPILHYIYEVTDHQMRIASKPSYRGAASLKVDASDSRFMRGNYFTSRGSRGHFSFERVAQSE